MRDIPDLSDEGRALADSLSALIARLQALCARPTGEGSPELSGIGAAILAARALDLAQDSRSLARRLGLAHALVLRECQQLAQQPALIELDDPRDRSLRLFYRLSATGRRLIQEALAP